MAPTVYTPPVNTYIPLGSVTLSATATEVTFAGIDQSYRDLILIGEGTATANTVIAFRYNGDTGSNYNRVFMLGDGSSPVSGSQSSVSSVRVGPWRTDRSNVVHQIMDYSATDKHKTSLTRANNSAVEAVAVAGRWANTAAISSITVLLDANQIASGSTFSIFGIAG